jgi:hypothetical protein
MKTIAIVLAMSTVALASCATPREPLHNRDVTPASSAAQNSPIVASLVKAGPSAVELTRAEEELYSRIMEYRREHGLPAIPVSKSLSFVAKLHVRDLENHNPSTRNFHSWSGNGPWQSVNYTPDHRYAKLMWTKPRELTKYPGNGYEIIYMHRNRATVQDAFGAWKTSPPHDIVMRNQDSWKRINWEAIGIGIFGHYAAVWFGEETDPESQQSGGLQSRLASR